jgi:hypothetical protein
METAFSVGSEPKLYNEDSRPAERMPVDSSMLTIVTVVQQFMVKFIGAMS